MSEITRMRIVILIGLVAGFGLVFHSGARGQSIAFQPEVSPLLSGAFVGVTPVVSADRRYVRLSLNTSFSQVNGFTTFQVPAAVSGGGGVGIGGIGGLTGMNGLLGGGGGGGGTGRAGSLNQGGGPLAGPIVLGDGSPPISRDGRDPNEMNWPKVMPDAAGAAPENRPVGQAAASGAGGHRRIQANVKANQAQRAAALKASRQQALAARRRSR